MIDINIVFIGYAVNENTASSLSGSSVAGNKMQLNILKNLMKYNDLNIKSITIYPVAHYPQDKKIYIKKEEISIFERLKSTKIGFLNIKVIKQIWQTFAVFNEAKKNVDKDTIILTFNLFPQVGLPVLWLKRKYNIEIVSILADLPIDDNVSRKGFSLLLRKYFDIFSRKAIFNCDKIITLNKYAIDLFSSPNTEYIVVEGGIDKADLREFPEKDYKKRNIVYSGALTEYSGIINLIEAMKYLNHKDVYLDIYGGGVLEEIVKNRANEMVNVHFYGKVDNNIAKEVQSEAYLLVNPRSETDLISKVTFPSKIFEYMTSGTPVLTTKLNGFTEDYYDKMYFVDTNDPKVIAEKIDEIMGLPVSEISKKAIAAREFILKNKTWEQQCKKIYDFIKKEHF